MKYSLILVLFLLLGLSAVEARADDPVTVNDMTQLSWQMDPSGKVWIWNLDSFDSSFLPCCYKYYIDTTTGVGKTQWSTVLAHTITGRHLTFYVSNKAQSGPITFLMN